jgi:hypothetical protein
MESTATTCLIDDLELAQGVFGRIASDLGVILDREIVIETVEAGRESQRAAGERSVHISFRLGVQVGERSTQGCLLVPLAEAVTLAGYMLMLTDDQVAHERCRTELDEPFKEALLEVGKFLAAACQTVLRRVVSEATRTRSEGCQGVRAGVRPAFTYEEGDELIVARARARVHDFEPCELILMLPADLL